MPVLPHVRAALPPADDTAGVVDAVRDALGILELSSIVRGHRVLDAMVKRAPIRVRGAYPVSGGKFLIFVDGEVAEVDEAMEAGLARCDARLTGKLFLPQVHEQVWDGLVGRYSERAVDAIGLLETESVSDCVLGADTALKAAAVDLSMLHLAQGIAGRAYFVVSGAQHDVEAAIEAAGYRVRPELVIEQDVITAPHDDMTLELLARPTIHPKY